MLSKYFEAYSSILQKDMSLNIPSRKLQEVTPQKRSMYATLIKGLIFCSFNSYCEQLERLKPRAVGGTDGL